MTRGRTTGPRTPRAEARCVGAAVALTVAGRAGRVRGCGLLLALALASAARASVDHYGLGDGHSGALSVATPGLVVNAYDRRWTGLLEIHPADQRRRVDPGVQERAARG